MGGRSACGMSLQRLQRRTRLNQGAAGKPFIQRLNNSKSFANSKKYGNNSNNYNVLKADSLKSPSPKCFLDISCRLSRTQVGKLSTRCGSQRLKINTRVQGFRGGHSNFTFLPFGHNEGKGSHILAPSQAHLLVMHSANTSLSHSETKLT